MSAPVTERARGAVRGRAAAIPAQRGIADGADPAAAAVAERVGASATTQTVRRAAEQKAYARRDNRARRASGVRPARAAAPAGRPQFVLLIMVLLAVGLVATLWLSTAAAADSYRLEDATAEARALSEQAERLHREVAVLESPPELARRAAELGMTPVRDPARLVVAPDGSVEVVGEPRAAVAPPPPAPPAPPGGQQPPGADGTVPEGAAPEGTGPAGTDTGENGAGENGTGENGTGENGTGENSTGENGTEQLAAPREEGRAPVAAAEGAREDAQAGAGSDADAGAGGDRRSGQEATETGPAAAAGRGGGTDAG